MLLQMDALHYKLAVMYDSPRDGSTTLSKGGQYYVND